MRAFRGTDLLFLVLCIILSAGCAASYQDGSLFIRLEYPPPGDNTAVSSSDPARGISPGIARPAYAQGPANRILIRVLAPHIPAPIEAWFDRSAGRGEISGIPPGTRIAVEVDEYDNTALTLLGRGWAHGVTLSPGENKTVTITMHDKGTILTVAGKYKAFGDNTQELLGVESYLNQPTDLEIINGDDLLILDYSNRKVKLMDRYGYLRTIAGDGTTIEIDGNEATLSGLSTPQSITSDPAGNIYIACTTSNKIKKLSNGRITTYAGTGNSASSPPGTSAIQSDINAPTSISYYEGDGLFFIELTVGQIKLIDLNDLLQERPDQSEYYGGQSGPITSVSRISSHKGLFLLVSKKSINEFNSYYGGLKHLYYGGLGFWPEGGCIYNNSKIFIADSGGYRIFINDVDSDQYIEFLGLSAGLVSPMDVAVDSRGNVYIADTGNHAIRMVVGGALP